MDALVLSSPASLGKKYAISYLSVEMKHRKDVVEQAKLLRHRGAPRRTSYSMHGSIPTFLLGGNQASKTACLTQASSNVAKHVATYGP